MNKTGHFWSGTSGLVLAEPNKKSFPVAYQDKSRLTYYASKWNSIEINSSFYKIPRGDTYRKWTEEVPEDFRFTVKLWKGITHGKEGCFEEQDLKRFFQAIQNLGNKKGCLLVQFPATTKWNVGQFRDLLESIRHLDPDSTWPIAAEFRHPEWYKREIHEILDQFNATLVLHDMPKSIPLKTNGGSPFVYFRFHGEKGDYRGSYGKQFLDGKASEIQKWLGVGKDVYAYFNNTMGEAIGNLSTLHEMVG